MTQDDMELRQALAIIARRRQRDLEETIIALDLSAAMLNVIREDALANQVLDIKTTLKSHIAVETKNAVDISRRPQTYEFSEHTRQTETMGEGSEQHTSANRDEARAIKTANAAIAVVAASASSPQTSKRKSK